MESIVKKSLSSLLIIMMLFAIAMPAIVNAAEEKFTMKDMKVNRIIYFEGDTYSAIHYACNNAKYKKETYPSGTAGIVWLPVKKHNSIVVQLSSGKFRTIKLEQVERIREEKFVNIEIPTLKELSNGDIKLNLRILGEENQVHLENNTNVYLDTDGSIVVGFRDGSSKLTIEREGKEPIDLYIIKDAEGNISLDVDDRKMSAEAQAVLCEKIRTGANASLTIGEDGKLEVAAGAEVGDAGGDHTYLGANAHASYDTKDPNADIMAGADVTVMDQKYESPEVDTRIVKAIKNLASSLFARLRK